jgi:predicted RNase H-like HicB family nuclease
VIIPPGFFKVGETIEMDPTTEAVEVGYAAGYRVLYTQYKGKWHAHTLDLRAVFGGGDTLEAAKRNMAEAVAFHLEDLPADQYVAPVEPIAVAR